MYAGASSNSNLGSPPGRLANGKRRTADIVDTLAVFQPAMGWLNADAEVNICEQHRSVRKYTPKKRDMSQKHAGLA